jgi:hypothetical protein
MKSYPPSQDEVFGAFLRWLNASRGASYIISGRPDEAERTKPEIDYLLREDETGREIGVEVSSVWRSKSAGKEDHHWSNWTESVRQVAGGRVSGQFHVYTALQVPVGLDPESFARALIELIHRNGPEIASSSRDSKALNARICGMDVFLAQAAEHGSDVQFARHAPNVLIPEFTEFFQAVLGKKSPKLKQYKNRGLETWLVVYNTIWPLLSPNSIRQIVRSAVTLDHAHIDHIGVVAGNPPDDAWVNVVRLAKTEAPR